jgi:hypothetical protein
MFFLWVADLKSAAQPIALGFPRPRLPLRADKSSIDDSNYDHRTCVRVCVYSENEPFVACGVAESR